MGEGVNSPSPWGRNVEKSWLALRALKWKREARRSPGGFGATPTKLFGFIVIERWNGAVIIYVITIGNRLSPLYLPTGHD
jgi:hypothetical protein